jgi:hypothetical protein
MMRTTLVAGLLMFMVPSFVPAHNELFEGIWKANVAKSKYVPGAAPKSETLRVEPVGDQIKVSLDGVNQQGPYHSEAIGKFDNVDVPVVATPARQATFTYAFRHVDERTFEIVIKVNREPRLLVRNVVSEDGKTLRSVATVIGPGVVNQDVIYEKQ